MSTNTRLIIGGYMFLIAIAAKWHLAVPTQREP